MSEAKQSVALRLICQNPPSSDDNGEAVEFGLQDQRGVLLPGTRAKNGSQVFEFNVDVLLTPVPNFLGPFTHGTPLGRFLYLGLRPVGSKVWTRRLKIRLTTMTTEQVEQAIRDHAVIEAVVDGSGSGTVAPSKPWTIRG